MSTFGHGALCPTTTETWPIVTMRRAVTGPVMGLCLEMVHIPAEVVGIVLPWGTALGGAVQKSCQLPGVELLALTPQKTWLIVTMARAVNSPLTGI